MKPMQSITLPLRALAALALIGSLATTAVLAGPASDVEAQYRSELAACRSGASQQDRQTCVYEAKSAYQQNKRGALQDRNPSYERNSSQRCDALSGDQRLACTQRMQGQGSTSGSAESGGIYRELVTRSTEAPAAE